MPHPLQINITYSDHSHYVLSLSAIWLPKEKKWAFSEIIITEYISSALFVIKKPEPH